MSAPFHQETTTTEPDEMQALFEQVGVRVGLGAIRPGFFYRERVDGDSRLTVSRLALGTAFSTLSDTQVFGVADVRGTRYDWRTTTERGSGAGAPVLFRPGHPALVVADALESTNVYLPAGVLQGTADTVYGTEEPVGFASSHPLNPRLGRYWSGLAALTRDTLASGAFAHELVRADLTRQLAVGMLECFPLAGDPVERALSMEAQTRRYRVAVQFLDDHASLPVTVEDAARAAGTTTVALVRAFRANHPQELTPLGYLRRTRLVAAHADLVNGDPTRGDTVREISVRWGFAHPGRFAAAYRRAYGVPPRWTLDR